MSIRNLDHLFNPRSLVLVGASDRAGSVGALVLRNLRRAGFTGEVMLINPHHRVLDDLPVYPDVASLPQAPDLAVIATPPDSVPGLIAELGRRGAKAAIVITAGFAELGPDGVALQHAALEAARPHLLRIIGPNCIGVMVPRIGLDASFSHLAPPQGDIALVSQSGAMVTAMLDWAAPRGLGFSHVVSLGDMADVDFGDMLDYLAADPHTRAILLYIEGITHARKFMSAARAAARSKPVIALKAGHSAAGARAATSHCGMLAGSDAAYDEAFRRAGMLRVGSMSELFDAAETLALTRQQRGEGLVIVTNGGGAGVLATDALEAAGGKLAALDPATIERLTQILPRTWSHANPVDLIGDATGQRYAKTIDALLSAPGADALLILNCPTALADPDDAANAVVDALAAAPPEKLQGRNVFTAWLGDHSAQRARQRFSAARIPTYTTPEAAVSGFLHRVNYQRNQELLLETPPARPDPFEPDVATVRRVIGRVLEQGRSWLAADEVAAVLGAYRIPQPAWRRAASPDEAAVAAADLGFPVAVKIMSPDITHKSDVGGVRLALSDRDGVRDAVAAMLSEVHQKRPEAQVDGVFVQQMVQRPGGIELIVGIAEDVTFGPLVVFGQGGVAVAAIQDSAVALPPLNMLLARRLMQRTRVWRLLQGCRGRPPAALDRLADVIIRIGQLAADHPEIRELDINPLTTDANGVIALDCRIRVAAAASSGASRLAIAPYPQGLEKVGRLPDGSGVQLRPIRPEDELLLRDLVANMTPEDVRMRFFAALQSLSHAAAARLTQIDYDREMAILALREDRLLGVVRYAADPDRQTAEYAIAVRSDCKGRGVGYLLMTELIAIAKSAGIGQLAGTVMRENRPMLDMCHALGFTSTTDPDDPALVRVQKSLRDGPGFA